MNQLLLEKADFIFRPDTNGIHWSEFDHYEKLIDCGEAEANNKINLLKKMLSGRSSIKTKLKEKIASYLLSDRYKN